ncbi:hypothetical protein [Paraburkholderia silvatlantica]|uniref:hypothetical protein n=1 Tax=Paraburkholderia silvatlantica TaxID=321895 RepID=UPI003750B5CA
MLVVPGLSAMSAFADVASNLTSCECKSHPFASTSTPLTSRQLQRELQEVEAVGYRPRPSNFAYPADIETAERRLHEEYRRDCVIAVDMGNGT